MAYTPPRPDPSLPPIRVNLYSDTQTKPSPAMRDAMMRAEVGDEQLGDDPTVNALCERMAALLGKEAALFLPSGTMCNQIAILSHCRPGDEVLAHERSHIITSEAGGAAALAGVMVTSLRGERGQFDVETLRAAIRPHTRNAPWPTLVAVEQTANAGGGAVWPIDRLKAVAEAAHEQEIATHMDGARLLNGTVASGIAPAAMAAAMDSVWLDFTKGLGAPLGAVLCGSGPFIDRSWRWKQRIGGSMRQAGICAAACLYALDHNVVRLAEDHTNAKALAHGLAQIPGVRVTSPETNLVFFETEATGVTADTLARQIRREGITISVSSKYRARACTHLDVNRAGVDAAVAVIRSALAG